MGMKLKTSGLCLAMTMIPMIGFASTVKTIQVFNNLYNQASSAGGVTATNVTVNFMNGATQCDTTTVTFRTSIAEVVGTGSNQKCADVTSVQIIAKASNSDPTLQVYSVTPVTVNLTGADYEHLIIIQDLGTGVTGTPASDGSIAPVFNSTDGSVTTAGTLGTVLVESKMH